MSFVTLYRKYRPLLFKDIVAQHNVVISLQNIIQAQKNAQAYVFYGPRGTGKTSTAKIFARTINCLKLTKNIEACQKCNNCQQNFQQYSPEIIEIDGASNNGVDEIRKIKDNLRILPSLNKFKIYIIDEVHMLTKFAFNSLLKSLEEPPKHIIFILITTEVKKIPITVLSRCQQYQFNLIKDEDIIKNLEKVLLSENISFEKKVLTLIAKEAKGSIRDSLSILEKILSFNHQHLAFESYQQAFNDLELKLKEEFINAIINIILDNGKKLNNLKTKLLTQIDNFEFFLINIANLLEKKASQLWTKELKFTKYKNNLIYYHYYFDLISFIFTFLKEYDHVFNAKLLLGLFIKKLIYHNFKFNLFSNFNFLITNQFLDQQVNSPMIKYKGEVKFYKYIFSFYDVELSFFLDYWQKKVFSFNPFVIYFLNGKILAASKHGFIIVFQNENYLNLCKLFLADAKKQSNFFQFLNQKIFIFPLSFQSYHKIKNYYLQLKKTKLQNFKFNSELFLLELNSYYSKLAQKT